MFLGTHWTVWITYAVMMAWVAPVALREYVALTLLAAWAAGEVVSRLAGDLLPLQFYFLADAMVICILISDQRFLPRLTSLLYPFAWAAYAFVDNPRTLWFCLWGITVAQFILAGWQGRLRGNLNDVERLATGQGSMAGGGYHSISAHLDIAPAHADVSLARKLGAAARLDGEAR
jgi:hypothetical protein